jgi:uncharacterized protein (TIGR02611 family)
VDQEQAGRRPPLIERVRARQERHRERNRVYRVVFATLGFLVLAAGVVMLVTPGPGVAVIILGLGMLALEFAWAERWLERIVETAEEAVDQVTHGSPVRRALLVGAGIAAAAAIVVTLVLWDVPYFPG